MSKFDITYPFTAIVGQEIMKKALILNVINPKLGGVLIKGEKGSAKSTAVRGLAEILSKRQVVELPVSATEDRVVGTLDIEHAIKTGEKKFEKGILAEANNNILYVDEINLLEDHIVDVLLDSAAMGINTIEREGISYSHPANFILVGTMNPEEGDLRPQLLDRFGMVVDVVGEKNIDHRTEVIKRRLNYERDEEEFRKQYAKAEENLRNKIVKAQNLLKEVQYEDRILEAAATLSITLEVDGHRADIAMIKTAMTIAAFNERTNINKEDIIEAAYLVLPHRMRRTPFEEGTIDFSQIEDIIETYFES